MSDRVVSGHDQARKDQLAVHIVETKAGRFEPEKFEDEYESALKELLRKNQKGEQIERPKEPSRANVVNLMDALRQSVKVENSGSTARRKLLGSSVGRAAKKPSRSASKQRKAGQIMVMRNVVKRARWVIVVRCLNCRHRGIAGVISFASGLSQARPSGAVRQALALPEVRQQQRHDATNNF